MKYKAEFSNVCESQDKYNPTGLEQASCYHALGHLLMYVTQADIPKSLGLCKELAIKPNRDMSQVCSDGVFMQIFQPLEPEDFALVKGKEVKKEDLSLFCRKFDGAKRGSCWSEGWPLFAAELKKPAGLVKYCGAAAPEERDRCYSALFYVLTAQFGFDVQKVQTFCTGLPEDRRGQCFANAASRMIETDYRNISKSVSLCVAGSPFDKENQCFKELLMYSTYNFHPKSEEFLKLCNSLPAPWNERCLHGDRTLSLLQE